MDPCIGKSFKNLFDGKDPLFSEGRITNYLVSLVKVFCWGLLSIDAIFSLYAILVREYFCWGCLGCGDEEVPPLGVGPWDKVYGTKEEGNISVGESSFHGNFVWKFLLHFPLQHVWSFFIGAFVSSIISLRVATVL